MVTDDGRIFQETLASDDLSYISNSLASHSSKPHLSLPTIREEDPDMVQLASQTVADWISTHTTTLRGSAELGIIGEIIGNIVGYMILEVLACVFIILPALTIGSKTIGNSKPHILPSLTKPPVPPTPLRSRAINFP